eukprot:481052_1
MMECVQLKRNKWSDQYIHKRFKNQSFGSLNHKIRARFSKPSRCSNSTKTNSVLQWKNRNCHRCIDRRKMMNFYKYVCIYADSFLSDIIDLDYNGEEYFINCDTCGILNADDAIVCKQCNVLINQYIPDTCTYNDVHQIDVSYVSKKKHKKIKRRKCKKSNAFETYWKEMKRYHDEYKILTLQKKKYLQKTHKYASLKGHFNENVQFKICVGSTIRRWGYWRQDHDSGLARNDSFVFTKSVKLNKNVQLNIMYSAVKNNQQHRQNLILFGTNTYNFLKQKRLLGITTKTLKDADIQHISKKYIHQFFCKNSTHIDEYIGTNIEPVKQILFQHSLRFSVIMTLDQHTEYAFLLNNIRMKKNNDAVLMEVPMKLKNFSVKECSIMIHDMNRYTDKLYHFTAPEDEEIYTPIYSCPFESVYNADVYPKTYVLLQNYHLKKVVKKCMMACFGSNENINIAMDKLQFGECHEPYYNLLPLSFKLSRLLVEFIPVRHIVKRILIPYVGYNKLHYIKMETVINFEKENEEIEYASHQYFEDRLSRWTLYVRKPHILEKNGMERNNDVVLLSIDGHEYVEESDSGDDSEWSTSNGSSIFIDLFGSDSD